MRWGCWFGHALRSDTLVCILVYTCIYIYICNYIRIIRQELGHETQNLTHTHTQISLNRKQYHPFFLVSCNYNFEAILHLDYRPAVLFSRTDYAIGQRQAVNKQHCCWLIKLYNKEASPIMGGCTPHFCFVRFTLPHPPIFIGPRPKFDWCTRKYVSYIMLPGKILTWLVGGLNVYRLICVNRKRGWWLSSKSMVDSQRGTLNHWWCTSLETTAQAATGCRPSGRYPLVI